MALATVTNYPLGRALGVRVIGTATLRANADTTTSYVDSSELDCSVATTVNVQFALTHNDGTSYEWTYWWSPDDSTWFQQTNAATTAGATTITVQTNALTIGATGTWCVSLPVQSRYFKVALKRTGGTGANKVAVTATMLGA